MSTQATEAPDVTIHVRFAPDGTVMEIGERPAALGPQAWFDRLSREAGPHYAALSGGRGTFRLARTAIDLLKAEA
jgi:hypothetical protein